MGTRGPLKIVPGGGRVAIADAAKGSAALRVSALAPAKPSAVANEKSLSDTWDELVPELDKAGLLSTADVMTLEVAVRHLRAIREMSDDFHADGAMIPNGEPDEDGVQAYKRNPAEQIFRAHSVQFMEIAKQLGMTWMSRARTAVPEGGASGERNPFEATGG